MSKPASGAFIQPVLDEAAVRQAPQRVRVYRAIRTAIAGGALAPGDRLPSARQLAADWGLARGAVDEAFAQLQMEGLIRRRVGDGTYVEPAAASAAGAGGRRLVPPPREPSDLAHHVLAQAARMGVAGASRSARWARSTPADQSTPSTTSGPSAASAASLAPSVQPAPLVRSDGSLRATPASAGPTEGLAPVRLECAFVPQRAPTLHPRAIDLDSFALPTWRRLLVAAASEQRRELLGPVSATGLPALRESVARYVGVMRGVPCRPEQVLIVASPAEGLNLLVRLLLPNSGSVWVEEPTHPSLPSLLESLGARVTAVPLDAQGFDVAGAHERDPAATLVYLHPLGHYPLGRRTTVARGDELIEWARRHGRWIVEGHFNDELWPREVQPPALARRDRERVFLLGTFESVMFPSLRLGYVVVPQALVKPFAEAITLGGPRAPAATQWALAEFIDRGHLHQRILALRERYAKRRKRVQSGLVDRLPAGVRAEPLTPVPTACLHLPEGASDLEWLRRLRAQGLVLEPLSGMHWNQRVERRPQGLVLGYGDWSDAVLDAALARLVQALREWREGREPPVGEGTVRARAPMQLG
ncbi:MAG: PLP-dependent aminotransferase family protein [Rubrivivax sp.]|nr:PLP-dependent aminotransferase family protein [Rubrivivax sp.]